MGIIKNKCPTTFVEQCTSCFSTRQTQINRHSRLTIDTYVTDRTVYLQEKTKSIEKIQCTLLQNSC